MTAATVGLQEAADLLGVHYMTAYRYVRTGRLPATRDGTEWRVAMRDIERLRDGVAGSAHRRGSRAAARAHLEARMVAGDEAGAWSVVESTLASGAAPSDIHVGLVVPALRSIGDRWKVGALTVADEHRATVVAQRIVGRLGPRFARRGVKRGTVVLGAVAGEEHALPGSILADLLRGVRFEVLDLGADTPIDSFVTTARDANRLVAVLVGAITSGREQEVRSTVAKLRRSRIGAPVLVGGAGIADADLAMALGADGWTGHDGESAIAAVEDAIGGG